MPSVLTYFLSDTYVVENGLTKPFSTCLRNGTRSTHELPAILQFHPLGTTLCEINFRTDRTLTTLRVTKRQPGQALYDLPDLKGAGWQVAQILVKSRFSTVILFGIGERIGHQ